MKNLILALALITSANSALAMSPVLENRDSVQLQIFSNYDPATKTYEGKVKSTLLNPLSAELLLADKSAICFRGSAVKVQDVIDAMLEIYNKTEENKRAPLSVAMFVRELDGERIAFKLLQTKDEEVVTFSWDSVRRCVRE